MHRIFKFLLLLVMIAAVALYFLPMRLVINVADLEDTGFSARSISGSIWKGRLEEVRLGSLELGDLDAGVQFFPLFTGRLLLDLERAPYGAHSGLTATIGRSGGTLFVQDATTKFNLTGQFAPLLASQMELNGVSAQFTGNRCQSASGQVRILLDANIPGLDLQRGLLGNAECQDGVLVLPLASGSGMEKLTLKLEGDGRYTARLSLTGGNAAWTLLLPTLGFQKTVDGYAIKMAGQLGQGLKQ